MERYFYMLAALCVGVNGAPPAPPRLYQQHAPAHLQNIHPLDYFTDHSEVANYYRAQQKQGNINGANGAPSRLESLEPDSEVELIPGAQQPQQPPQQAPVSPNIPGLIPGQRVFIVHMPVPGYRPGTIGGYQPVYIVAAGAQGNTGYPTNGYQNAILVNPGQAFLSPFLGYSGQGVGVGQGVAGVGPAVGPGQQQIAHAGLVVGPAQLQYTRPFEQAYQDHGFAYQQSPVPQGAGVRGALNLSQLVSLQGQPGHPANQARNAGQEAASSSEPKQRVGSASESEETKEALQEPRRNARPAPAHAQARNNV